jgi:hypothetical protein
MKTDRSRRNQEINKSLKFKNSSNGRRNLKRERKEGRRE